MAKRPNFRLIKLHRSYTVEEVAETLSVHKNTVRNWLRSGLTPIDERRPILIHGETLRGYLQKRRDAAKRPCGVGKFYCLRCRTPVRPAGGMADYLPITPTSGNLRGICPNCDTLVHRRVAWDKVTSVAGDLDVSFPEVRERIRDRSQGPLNCDLQAAD